MIPPQTYTTIDGDFSRIQLHMLASGNSMSTEYRFIQAMQEELDGLVRRFERVVWLGGLREITKNAERKNETWTLRTADFVANFWMYLGRAIVQLERGDTVIQFAFDPSRALPSGGISRVHGSLDDLQVLVSKACESGRQGQGFAKDRRR